MTSCFRDQLRAARTPSAIARLWLRTIADFSCSLPAQHLGRFHFRHKLLAHSEAFRQSIFFARAEASSFSRHEITVEDMLLGLLRTDGDLAERLGPDAVAAMVRTIEATEARGRRVPPHEDLRLSFAARRASDAAQIFSREGEAPRRNASVAKTGSVFMVKNTNFTERNICLI